MKQYKISCDCGENLWVNGSLAGELFTCTACENELQLPSLGKLKSLESRDEQIARTKQERRLAKTASRSKVDELAIFAIGFGVVIGALIIWLGSVTKPDHGDRTAAFFAIPLTAAAVLITLGIAVKTLRNKTIVYTALILLGGLFVADSIVFLNIGKLLVSGTIVGVIAKGCSAAIAEIENG